MVLAFRMVGYGSGRAAGLVQGRIFESNTGGRGGRFVGYAYSIYACLSCLRITLASRLSVCFALRATAGEPPALPETGYLKGFQVAYRPGCCDENAAVCLSKLPRCHYSTGLRPLLCT